MHIHLLTVSHPPSVLTSNVFHCILWLFVERGVKFWINSAIYSMIVYFYRVSLSGVDIFDLFNRRLTIYLHWHVKAHDSPVLRDCFQNLSWVLIRFQILYHDSSSIFLEFLFLGIENDGANSSSYLNLLLFFQNQISQKLFRIKLDSCTSWQAKYTVGHLHFFDIPHP